ncbi:hypothetical protein [Desulfovibrio sp. JC010]|uniref:hypothetical protein n=1 Tax=Desulfovibrio sp. JC010 TaxID=2593641 RepID=UPI0013D1EDF9|nr:hypothetical protein [Desulfovibrio sp. JC010]NDV25693.1 hypothetical protein [Desulfovibrio sp. JC010]
MPWIISDHKIKRLFPALIIALICVLPGCKKQPKLVIPPAPPLPEEVAKEKAPLGKKEVRLHIKLTRQPDQRKVRKVRSQSMPVGTRISYPAGADILRFLQYDEEIITLPKIQAARDFKIMLLTRDQNPPQTVNGYPDVTYELMESALPGGAILLDSFYGTLKKDGTLSKTMFLPTNRKDVFKKIQAEISPRKLKFKKVVRTSVLPGSEHHYVIRFVGKKGMTILFEIRYLEGGSRPKVVSRQTLEIPLGTPLIEINGHSFRVHTATTEFIDIERLS